MKITMSDTHKTVTIDNNSPTYSELVEDFAACSVAMGFAYELVNDYVVTEASESIITTEVENFKETIAKLRQEIVELNNKIEVCTKVDCDCQSCLKGSHGAVSNEGMVFITQTKFPDNMET